MPQLPRSLQALASDDFATTLKAELKELPEGSLPLLHGLNEGGIPDDSNLDISVLGHEQHDDVIQAHIACFFTEVVGGCNCHDDPYTRHAYCELRVRIDRETAAASFTALTD